MTTAGNTDWLVYILECSDKTLYTGITNNLEKRLEQHKSGEGGANRSEATKREYAIKKLKRDEKIKLINSV